jgi:ribose transport system substrate-binding protein
MKRLIRGHRLRWIGAVAVSALVAGCGSSSASSSGGGAGTTASAASGSGKTYNVTFVPGVADNAYFNTIAAEMSKLAPSLNMKLTVAAPAEFDPSVETSTLNGVLASKPDLLLVTPVSGVALRPAIQRFLDEHIPVILLDSKLNDMQGISSLVYANQPEGGKLAADAMGKALGGSGQVATMNIAAGTPSLDARVSGFVDEMHTKFPNIKVVAEEEGGGTPGSNEAAMRSLLLAYPDLKGLFGVTEVQGEGAAAASQVAGKNIYIAAFDATPQEVTYLNSGRIQFLSAQDPRTEGQLGITYAHDVLDGDTKAVPSQHLLSVMGVTKANINTAAVKFRIYSGGGSE